MNSKKNSCHNAILLSWVGKNFGFYQEPHIVKRYYKFIKIVVKRLLWITETVAQSSICGISTTIYWKSWKILVLFFAGEKIVMGIVPSKWVDFSQSFFYFALTVPSMMVHALLIKWKIVASGLCCGASIITLCCPVRGSGKWVSSSNEMSKVANNKHKLQTSCWEWKFVANKRKQQLSHIKWQEEENERKWQMRVSGNWVASNKKKHWTGVSGKLVASNERMWQMIVSSKQVTLK